MTNYEMIKHFTPQHFARFILNPFPLIQKACDTINSCDTTKCRYRNRNCEDCLTKWLLTERKEVHKIENDEFYNRMQEISEQLLIDIPDKEDEEC